MHCSVLTFPLFDVPNVRYFSVLSRLKFKKREFTDMDAKNAAPGGAATGSAPA